jgi:hypothetical protein
MFLLQTFQHAACVHLTTQRSPWEASRLMMFSCHSILHDCAIAKAFIHIGSPERGLYLYTFQTQTRAPFFYSFVSFLSVP